MTHYITTAITLQPPYIEYLSIFLAWYSRSMIVLDDNPDAPEAEELEAWAERELKRLKARGTVETAHLPAGSPQARALSELLGLSEGE